MAHHAICISHEENQTSETLQKMIKYKLQKWQQCYPSGLLDGDWGSAAAAAKWLRMLVKCCYYLGSLR